MLTIRIPDVEIYSEQDNQFIYTKGAVVQLEHSLQSVSKWEEKWEKPFLVKEKRTTEEMIDYIKCMTLNEKISDEVYKNVSDENVRDIERYIERSGTATKFSATANEKGSDSTFLTSELIYWLMSFYNIPFECDKWFLNRLLTLIKICQIKNESPKKMSKEEIRSRNSALNKKRRAQMHSKG